MTHQQRPFIRTLFILVTLILAIPSSQAATMHMNMPQHGYHHPHMRGPHNAAVHFLKMADTLQLGSQQISRLIKLRDAYIEKNSVAESQLFAARTDLRRLIMADSIDVKAVDQKLTQIGALEAGLWRAFVIQLHDIKAMLSAKQKKRLEDMHRRKMCHGKY